jgi:hypothetical protein
MFAIIQNDQVAQYVPDGSSFTWDGVQYPPQWVAQATPEQMAEIGMLPVVYGNYPNDYFYWVSQDTPVISATEVTINYSASPKDITQLKSQMTAQVNQTAYTILLPSDWMVVKAIETGGTVAPDWNTWRQTIRTEAADAVTVIEACTTVDELAALPSITWIPDPSQAVPQPVVEAVEEVPTEVFETPVETPVEPVAEATNDPI